MSCFNMRHSSTFLVSFFVPYDPIFLRSLQLNFLWSFIKAAVLSEVNEVVFLQY